MNNVKKVDFNYYNFLIYLREWFRVKYNLRGVYSMKSGLHIYQKIIIVFLLLLGPIYLISVYVNVLGSKYLQNEILNTTMLNFKFYSKHFNEQFEHIKKQQLIFVNNQDVQNLNFDPAEFIEYRNVETTDRVMENIAAIKDSSNYVKDVGIYIKAINKTFSFFGGISNIPNDEYSQLQAVLVKYDSNSTVTFFNDKAFMIEMYPQTKKNVLTSKIISYLEIDQDAIKETLKQIITSKNSGAVLCDDGFNSVISYKDDRLLLDRFDKNEILSIIQKRTTDKFYSEVDGKGYWVICDRISLLNMNLITYVSVDDVAGPLKKLNMWLIILSVVSVFILIVFSLSINIMIHRPMERFTKAFVQLQSDNFDIDIEHNSNDEFGYLYKSFNTMVRRLKQSILENYEQKIALQQSELKQLQSQINPHFLYNSFFNIYRMCKSENYDSVATITQKLGSYYQYITRSGADEVPLQMEYRHAMDYIEIQSIRFANRISVYTDPLPEECKNLTVPKIILQPVIENAFEHGFENKIEGGNIYIHISYSDNQLLITVEDDGETLSDEAFEALENKLENANEVKEKTGLINVCSRIRIKYGKSSGLFAQRSLYGGIKIIIKIDYPS